MKTIHLPLRKKWFDLIKQGIKKEEYREITPYWLSRFCVYADTDRQGHTTYKTISERQAILIIDDLPSLIYNNQLYLYNITDIHFTLGYPKKDDLSKQLHIKCKKISIGNGRTEWGAELNKFYFVLTLDI